MKNLFLICMLIVCIELKWINCNWKTIDLIPNRIYRLHWNLLEKDQSIEFKVEVKSRGYFGLGISRTGKMDKSDIVTGHIHSNGTVLLYDRFPNGQKMPEINEKSNWQLISGKRNETHLIFEFKRKLSVEDEGKDVAINKGATNVIYSLGKVDPKDRTKIKYHGTKSRGAKEILFY